MFMTLQDMVEQGVIIAKEIGEIIINAIHTLYATDSEVIIKYVLILVLAGLLISGLRLLGDELEEERVRKGNESGKLPWYLHGWTLFHVITIMILVIYAVFFALIL